MGIQNYRGVSRAFVINVLEGEGTEESPKRIERYILEENKNGEIITTGKFVQLDSKNNEWIGKL